MLVSAYKPDVNRVRIWRGANCLRRKVHVGDSDGGADAFGVDAARLLLGYGICVFSPNPPVPLTCAISAQLKRATGNGNASILSYDTPFLKSQSNLAGAVAVA